MSDGQSWAYDYIDSVDRPEPVVGLRKKPGGTIPLYIIDFFVERYNAGVFDSTIDELKESVKEVYVEKKDA